VRGEHVPRLTIIIIFIKPSGILVSIELFGTTVMISEKPFCCIISFAILAIGENAYRMIAREENKSNFKAIYHPR
jgi:hypothetical protein